MFCPNCGNQLATTAKICNKCGFILNQSSNINNQFIASQKNDSNKKLLNNKFVLIVVAIVIIGITFYIGKDYIFKNDKLPEETQQNNEQSNNNNNNDNSSIVQSSDAFLFPIEDVFTITGRGTVVTGRVERGSVKVGDEIEIVGLGEKKKVIVLGIEMFREMKDEVVVGDNAGILLKDINKEDVQRGQVLSKVNSIGLYNKFKANIYVLKKEEGGSSAPFVKNYKPQFYFRTTDITGEIEMLNGIEMISQGDTTDIIVKLENSIAMEIGTEFSLRDGGRTVGTGTVIETLK